MSNASPLMQCPACGTVLTPDTLVTSYLVHGPGEHHVLRQTRLFRGRFYSLIALDHLYHLEHHLYPQVPHQNWKRLARRLDPCFRRAGLEPRQVF